MLRDSGKKVTLMVSHHIKYQFKPILVDISTNL